MAEPTDRSSGEKEIFKGPCVVSMDIDFSRNIIHGQFENCANGILQA